MPVEHIRISQQAKEQLIKVKRHTGIQNWNFLCRWAFCLSIADPSIPSIVKLPADSSVEMSWKVFGGTHHELYLALLKERCYRDNVGTDDDALTTYFKLHLHRGIGYLGADRQLKSIDGLMKRIPRLSRKS